MIIASGSAAVVAVIIGLAGPATVGADAGRLGWRGTSAPVWWTVVTAAIAAVLALAASPAYLPAVLPSGAIAVVAGATPALAYFDVRLHRLPDRIVWPSIAVGAALLAADTGLNGAFTPSGTSAAATAVIGAAVFLVIRALPGSGLGFGDVKLAGLLGLAVGAIEPAAGPAALFIAVVSAGLAASFLIVTRRASMRDSLAYGPFLLFGAWTAVIAVGVLSVRSVICCVG